MTGLAFYDLDGTLVSSNVVTQYAWYARRCSLARYLSIFWKAPYWLAVDSRSRLRFNQVFFREYRGMTRDWLEAGAAAVFEKVLQPHLYTDSRALIARDLDAGYHTVLLTGSLDFAVAPLVRFLGLNEAVTNRLEYEDGVATGNLLDPVIAGEAKVAAIQRLCRQYRVDPSACKAYSDSASDAPMLEAVGLPAAANPDRRLRAIAAARGWPILNLKERYVDTR